VVLTYHACGWAVEWAAVEPPTVVTFNYNPVLHNILLCWQVTITTRQLVSHLAGVRHYEKRSNSGSSSKNKETASKEVKDKKNVSLLLAFVDVFCFLLLHLHVGHCMSYQHIHCYQWFSWNVVSAVQSYFINQEVRNWKIRI
jgi:hypothetical protein